MPAKPKFHLDESVTVVVAKGLRSRDRDCSTTQEAGLMAVSDPEQLAYAKAEDRVLITADQDFLALVKDDLEHPGVIYWGSGRHFGLLIKSIDELCYETTAEELRGTVTYL